MTDKAEAKLIEGPEGFVLNLQAIGEHALALATEWIEDGGEEFQAKKMILWEGQALAMHAVLKLLGLDDLVGQLAYQVEDVIDADYAAKHPDDPDDDLQDAAWEAAHPEEAAAQKQAIDASLKAIFDGEPQEAAQ